MKHLFYSTFVVVAFFARMAEAQIFCSDGTYAQNFNTLASTNAFWTNNLTLPGWYASKSGEDNTNTLAGAGTSITGGIYSFATNGVNAATDRALGSVATGTTTPIYYGVRFTNDTGLTLTNLAVSYAGEQWRVGSSATVQKLAFSYLVSSAPVTNSFSGSGWINFAALDFSSPDASGATLPLDGNAAINRATFTNVALTGAVVLPGQEFFLRWQDVDDGGTDSGLAVDDLTVSFQTTSNLPPVVIATNNSITLMTYNVKGNGTTDWSTNAVQVQAIGRQLIYLNPDIITFNEIPYTNTWQMANWVTAYLPGYFLATNSGTDGFIRSVVASRFPINRSKSWLDGADLKPFGYTNTSTGSADNFTRDLFEAEIAVSGWPQPLHVFTTHLKSTGGTTYADAAAKRAAEAAAITNFLATNFFTLYPLRPFTLSGDMNDGDTNALAIQRLISAPTTLRLTNPTNPVTGSINTFSIQGSLSERIDYIFPCTLLRSNVLNAQVFRTDLLVPVPPNLFSNDDKIASDHLPVLMTLANPFAQPFRVTAFSRSNPAVNLSWNAVPGGIYRVENSTNLADWTTLATNLMATNYSRAFTTNAGEPVKFFRVRTQ